MSCSAIFAGLTFIPDIVLRVMYLSPQDFRLLIFPALLLAYYLLVWLLTGRDPQPGVVVPQYTPPGKMSPAEMRYLLTGSSDRKTVAAVLAHLAAQKIIAIQNASWGYQIKLLRDQPPADIPPEEAAALRALAELADFACSANPIHPRRTIFLPYAQGKSFSLVASVVTGSLIQRVGRLYFKRNLRYSLPAVALSIAVAMVTAAAFSTRDGAIFLTFWFLCFSLVLGLIIATNVIPAIRDAFRGMLGRRSLAYTFLPLPLVLGIPGLVAVYIARATTPLFAVSLAALAVVNIAGGVVIQNITPLARQRMDQVEGFKHFLESVELDPLKRMNDPHLTPALLNDYLAYAIALDLKEAWGDQLADTLFATTPTSG